MSLIINKDIVIKNITDDALVCDRPCWLYCIKCAEGIKIFPERISLHDGFFKDFFRKPIALLDLTSNEILRFKTPLRFNKALFCIPEGVQLRITLFFIPDY